MSSNGASTLLLNLGPLGPATDDRRCSCVIASAPATMSILCGSQYLKPAQELLGEVVRMADLAAGAGDEAAADKQEQLDADGHHRAARRAAMNDGDGIQAKLLGLLSEVTCCYSSCVPL